MAIYILQFASPLGNPDTHQAQYYIGSCLKRDLQDRIDEHRAGRGAAITRACVERGITFDVVLILPGGRKEERALKNKKNTRRFLEGYFKKRNEEALHEASK